MSEYKPLSPIEIKDVLAFSFNILRIAEAEEKGKP